MKVKSNAQVSMTKNSKIMQVDGEDSAPNLNFSKCLELSETIRAGKLIDCRLIQTKPTVADMTLPGI